MNYIEKAYQNYVKACFGHTEISKVQDIELRKAFFAGTNWLKGILLTDPLDREENVVQFLIDIQNELEDFVEKVKQEIN